MTAEATLLGDAYAPVTSSIGFLEAPLSQVAEALRNWRASIHGSARVIALDGGLVDNVHALEPLTGGVRPRELLIATRGGQWTAVFDCGVQGGDQVTTVGFLARTIMCRGVVVVSVPDQRASQGLPERFGARQLQLFGPISTGFLNYVRTISLTRDGSRWRFDANGTVQDFEDVSAYSRKKVVEKFTAEMLVDYCAALGLAPFEEEFYSGPSALVTNPATPPPDAWVCTIVEVQKRRGIVTRPVGTSAKG